MPKSVRAALVAVAAFALLWLFAREVLALLLLGAAMVFALAVATTIVVALVDLAGPTRTDADGNVLGWGGRMRARASQLALALGARPWRTPAGVRATAMRATTSLRVTRPGGPAAAEHLVVAMNPQTVTALDDHQHLDEVVWDLAENYREATAGLPAAAGMVTVWMFADPRIGVGRVRVRTALREPLAGRAELVAHASRPLDPGRILPRGQGAREGFPAPAPHAGQQTPSRHHGVATPPVGTAGDRSGDRTEVLTRVKPTPPTRPDDPELTRPVAADRALQPRDDTVPLATGAQVVGQPRWTVRLDADGQGSAAVREVGSGQVLVVGRADPTHQSGGVADMPAGRAVLVIPDVHISRSHLELRAESGQLLLTDLGSSTGTFLAGQRLRPAEPVTVNRGAVIELALQPATGRAAARLHIS